MKYDFEVGKTYLLGYEADDTTYQQKGLVEYVTTIASEKNGNNGAIYVFEDPAGEWLLNENRLRDVMSFSEKNGFYLAGEWVDM